MLSIDLSIFMCICMSVYVCNVYVCNMYIAYIKCACMCVVCIEICVYIYIVYHMCARVVNAYQSVYPYAISGCNVLDVLL